ALAGGIDVLRDQLAEPGALGQRHDRDQPGMRHEIRVIKGRVRPREAMQQSHLTGVLSNQATEASITPIVPVQRAPFAFDTPEMTLFTRWIEAQASVIPGYDRPSVNRQVIGSSPIAGAM